MNKKLFAVVMLAALPARADWADKMAHEQMVHFEGGLPAWTVPAPRLSSVDAKASVHSAPASITKLEDSRPSPSARPGSEPKRDWSWGGALKGALFLAAALGATGAFFGLFAGFGAGPGALIGAAAGAALGFVIGFPLGGFGLIRWNDL